VPPVRLLLGNLVGAVAHLLDSNGNGGGLGALLGRITTVIGGLICRPRLMATNGPAARKDGGASFIPLPT
jgi:hypothetical protein